MSREGRLHTFVVNYLKRDGGRRGRRLVHVGFFAHRVPRPVLLCRLFGHRPVVDGYDSPSLVDPAARRSRWVCCSRCGRRGNLQGKLDPDVFALGDRYLGPWDTPFPPEDSPEYHKAWLAAKNVGVKDADRGYTRPGPIPAGDRGTLGGELVIGGGFGGLGFELKVGNRGSEHTLAARLSFGWLGTLYLHTADGFGQGVQRWLNPDGYESRVIGVDLGLDEIEWKLWSKRDEWSKHDPWWQRGGLHLRPLDRLLGRKRYEYEPVPGCVKVGRFVQMPEDQYLVELTLQRCVHGRRRGLKKRSWSVDWNALGQKGIPTKGPERGRIFGSGVEVPAASVKAGTWPAEAAVRIALRMTESRTSYGWDPVAVHKPEQIEVPV